MALYEKLTNPFAFIVFVLTLSLPVLIGFFTMRRTRNQTDFFIGGRAMNKFVVALSAVSSGRSAWLVLGVSGIAYTRGTGAVWAVVGYILAEMFQFIYIGRKLRQETETYNSLTLLDYLESKYKDKYMIRITGAVIIAIFITAYVAAQFTAGAKSLSAALGLSEILALVISGILVLVYMILGGYIAVAYNDVVRAIIMLFGLVVFPIYGLFKIGGLTALLETLRQLDPLLIDPFSLSLGMIIGFLGIGLGSPGQPHIIVRYMSIDDPDKLRVSAVIGTFWNVIMAWGAVFIGLLGRVAVPVQDMLPDKNHEMIYLVLSSQYFGPILYGLLIGGIFAAILSTADSQLLVVASTFVRDIYEKIIYEKILKNKEPIPEDKKLRMSRYVVFFSGILALVLAYVAKDAIFWLVLFAWGGLGAAFGTTVIFSLYWKRTTKYGIVAGMITGTVVTIIWRIFFKSTTGIYELIPAFACSALAIVIISLFGAKKT
jgi:solute:Na+ symporter, SSS family